MRRPLPLLFVCCTGCIMVAAPSSFVRSAPAESALVFGRFTVDGQPLREMRVGHFGDLVFASATNALLDTHGNFAFVVEPGAYYLHWYEPAGQRTRFFDPSGPPDPVFHFEVSAGDLRWLGDWEELGMRPDLNRQTLELRRRDSTQPVDVLRALVSLAKGTRWEERLSREVALLTPAPPDNP